MVYESRVDFTFDVICPWTYLSHRRLTHALSTFSNTPNPSVTFTMNYVPYQLYPAIPSTSPLEKHTWYLTEKYNSDPSQLAKYATLMRSYGAAEQPPIPFQSLVDGEMGNTFEAHRIIQLVQKRHGSQTAGKLVEALYRLYFEDGRHPSRDETLRSACVEAGIGEDEDEVAGILDDKEKGKDEVAEKLAEQRSNGVDAVPVVVVEGRRRDFTLQGAKSVEEYVKALEQVVKEAK